MIVAQRAASPSPRWQHFKVSKEKLRELAAAKRVVLEEK
jgi:hypothetical protein